MYRRYWEWDRPFGWDPARTALLIIDMQEGFLREGSPLMVPMAAQQVPVLARVQQAFRERGLPVVQTRFVVRDDAHVPFYRSIAQQRGIDARGTSSPFAPQAPDAEITELLAPAVGEPVVDKIAYDGFADTELELLLRSRGVDTLVIAGTVVNWCVDSTLRAAFHRRFNSIVLADGVSGYDHAGATGEAWVAQELDFFAESFAGVMESDELIRALDDPGMREPGVRSRPPQQLDNAPHPPPERS